ncbi:uncharacterized protein LOC107267131 isoform X1 [Cephus cinctus]|uniref:Uncharacterized protein LOC107267131 isoform X1 n=1 Tax=Cephus cinctus TaxID=211228 RepID=A0AAJ7W125_CEPCN|nr:uncharacterized protein LOC107267131 isoform X1 [Cephus cinctus]
MKRVVSNKHRPQNNSSACFSTSKRLKIFVAFQTSEVHSTPIITGITSAKEEAEKQKCLSVAASREKLESIIPTTMDAAIVE